MKVTVLSEAKAGYGLQSEHGLSFYIEVDNMRILFDTGASDLFRRNADRLDIDLDTIESVILSHGHFDHGNGLGYLAPTNLICHPACFTRRFRKDGYRSLGINLTMEEARDRFDLHTSGEPVQVSEHLYFLGEIPRGNDFEAQSTPYITEGGEKDFLVDDSGLACITGEGLVIVSGCAHSGICNMIQHAISVTGIQEIRAVMGGFHLKEINHQTRETIEYLKRIGTGMVLPSHCTMEPALGMFHKVFGRNEVKVGQTFTFD